MQACGLVTDSSAYCSLKSDVIKIFKSRTLVVDNFPISAMLKLANDFECTCYISPNSPPMYKPTFPQLVALLILLTQIHHHLANGLQSHSNVELPKHTKRTTAATPCNVNICFAMDGSDTITWEIYERQKSFVGNIVRLINRRQGVSYAAVQYGISNHAVSPLTQDVNGFLSALAGSTPVREAGSFVTAGLNYCFGELQRVAAGKKKIVLLGDGRRTIGSDPGERASLFFSTGGEVFVVGVGWRQDWATLKEIAGGDASKVFSIGPRDSLWYASTQLVEEICSRD